MFKAFWTDKNCSGWCHPRPINDCRYHWGIFWTTQVTSASILWRTEQWDNLGMRGFSEAALVLGCSSDPGVRGIVFQNYQVQVDWKRVVSGGKGVDGSKHWRINGGFLLPQAFRENAIVTMDQQPTRNWTSLPQRSRSSRDSDRRIFSRPA
jgi:hypothetical protein